MKVGKIGHRRRHKMGALFMRWHGHRVLDAHTAFSSSVNSPCKMGDGASVGENKVKSDYLPSFEFAESWHGILFCEEKMYVSNATPNVVLRPCEKFTRQSFKLLHL